MLRRQSIFWFFYLGGLGIFFPFCGLYLRENLGFSGTRVGLVMAMVPIGAMLTQTLWGQLSDLTGSRRFTLALACLGTAVTWTALGLPRTFGSALLATFLAAAFFPTVPPMASAVALATVGSGPRGFGVVRMWGTIGYLVMVVLFPPLLSELRTLDVPPWWPWQGLGWMFPAAGVLALCAAGATFFLPQSEALTVRAERGDVLRLLRQTPIQRFLFFVFASHLVMQGPIQLFPLWVKARGGDAETISHLWIFMLLLEIPLIGLSGVTLKRFGARGLLRIGLFAEAVRWTTCSFVQDLTVIHGVQMLHGVGVAGVFVGAVLYLEEIVPERLRSTGQTLISTAGFGAGSILSTVLVGYLFDLAGPDVPYRLAGFAAFVLALSTRRLLPEPKRLC